MTLEEMSAAYQRVREKMRLEYERTTPAREKRDKAIADANKVYKREISQNKTGGLP